MKKIIAYIEAHGGATIKDGKIVTFDTGYQVSFRDVYLVERHELKKYLKIAIAFAADYAHTGVWYDDERQRYCIDYSKHVKTFNEALTLGKMMNQKAIYDWAADDSVDILNLHIKLLSHAQYCRRANLRGACLSNADLRGADLTRVNSIKCWGNIQKGGKKVFNKKLLTS